MPRPGALAERLRFFEHSGRVLREADALFSKTSWLAVMQGQGLQARGFDPLDVALPSEYAAAGLARIAQANAMAAEPMPVHDAFVQAHCAAR
ncbi:tryptophan 7-halogenase [Xanthomonas sp. GPE 39]|uniref:tryptophan 7-halogenase n=1 Tax=Xanthomonas sp. GPE 39 TaxID=1583099 RepID=UPI000A4B6804|nr:tryptophan 7-halogenase [Xanthomonas sp. GPE 39]